MLVETAGEWQLAAPVEDIGGGARQPAADDRQAVGAADGGGVPHARGGRAWPAWNSRPRRWRRHSSERAERVEEWCEGLARTASSSCSRVGRRRWRTGRRPGATGSSTRCISRCCTSGWRRRGARGCIAASANGERAPSARERRTVPRSWRCTSSADRITARAIEYLTQAADNAMRRQAPHEAVGLLGRSLTLLKTLPDSPRPRPARAGAARRHRRAAPDDQGLRRGGGRAHLRAGARALPADRREPAAPAGTRRAVPLLTSSAPTSRPRVHSASRSCAWPSTRSDPLVFLVAHSLLGCSLSQPRRVRRRARASGEGHRPLRSSAAPLHGVALRRRSRA